MRKLVTLIALIAVALPLHFAAPADGKTVPPVTTSPPGHVKVIAINAHQNRILGRKRWNALYELAGAIRERPPAFDGGFQGAVAAPDAVILQEMRPSYVEIIGHLLKQRFGFKYQIVGPTDSAATIVINTERITLQGEVTTWSDVCTDETHPTDGRKSRNYEYAHFIENSSGAQFVVAGMHAAKNYATTGFSDCFIRNIEELRRQLSNETAPVIIGGDFNRRAVAQQHECDENEESEPQPWWSMMTTPSDGGRAYEDTVFTWNRTHHISMADEWTHEQKVSSVGCDASAHVRRSRIDYLFSAGAGIAEAHADHPGWAGARPGTRNATNFKYSDHRWVWGRFAIAGPPAPPRPLAAPQRGGNITVSWQPVDGAASYVIYRALQEHAYRVYRRVPSTESTLVDEESENGVVYRYAVAGVSEGGAVGVESRPVYALADSRGPHVTGVRPRTGAVGVDPAASVEVFLDEPVAPSSVDSDTIKVYAHGRRIPGFVARRTTRRVVFNPNRLAKGTEYRVVVRDLRDELGNVGPRFQWSFTTVPLPPKKHR
jgi:endonuclease/exonuclease/phosphatase family metal-dependent hydrolase